MERVDVVGVGKQAEFLSMELQIQVAVERVTKFESTIALSCIGEALIEKIAPKLCMSSP